MQPIRSFLNKLYALYYHIKLNIKKALPQTLFGRALIIIIMPMLLTQAISILVFYESQWRTISNETYRSIIDEIQLILDIAAPRNQFNPENKIIKEFEENFNFKITFYPNQILQKQKKSSSKFNKYLEKNLPHPYQLQKDNMPFWSHSNYFYHLQIQLENGILEIAIPQNRLLSSSTFTYFSWMLGSALITLVIAIIFMRNQIRPIKRLADAAEAFGRGDHAAATIRPSGASEVKQVARSFNLMRQRILRQVAQRTTMLAGVSHDLRAPLTRIKLELELTPPSEMTEALKSDIAEMEQMIDEYLAFAKGEEDEPLIKVNLHSFLDEVITQAKRQKINCIFEEKENANPIKIPIKISAFKRCLSNILLNADHYANKIYISIHTSPHAINIYIDDDGPGIPNALRKNVLKPFYRVNQSRTPNKKGNVGLGLTIARDIIHAHGGDIRLEQSPYGGLRVIISLPI